MAIDWTHCPDVETNPDVMSGTPVVRGTRIPAQAVLDNAADGYTAGQIVGEIYPSLPLDSTTRILAFVMERHVQAYSAG